MTKYLVDGKAPGQFRARCNMTVAKLDDKLTVDERREAQEKGYHRSYDLDRRNKVRWFVHFPQCEGFETTDPLTCRLPWASFMCSSKAARVWETFSRSVRAGWRPSLSSSREVKGLKVCPDCGLTAEVDDRASNVLWWDEHLRGCHALAEVS